MNDNFARLPRKDDTWEEGRPTKRVRIQEPTEEIEPPIDPALSDYHYPEPPSPPRPYDSSEIQYEGYSGESEQQQYSSTSSLSHVLEAETADAVDARIDAGLDDDWFESILATGDIDDQDIDYTFNNDGNASDDDFSDGPKSRGEGRRQPKGEATRGRGRPRGRPRGSRAGTGAGRGRPRKASSIDEDPSPRKRSAPGSRRGAGRAPRPPRKQPEASPEVAALLQKANAALMSGDIETALAAATDAVHANPEIHQGHILAAEALDKLGRENDAIDALQFAGSAFTDPDFLKDVARRIAEKNREFKHDDRLKELYTKIVDRSKDRWDYEARRNRLDINTRKGHPGHAMSDCVEILKHDPLNVPVLQILAELAPKSRHLDMQKIFGAFEQALDAAKDARTAGNLALAERFEFSLLNTYLDLLLEEKRHVSGIAVLRDAARWIMGREEEQFWDEVDDDREWDDDALPRRQEVPSYMPGKFDPSTYTLPIELRIKLGLFRFHLDPPQLGEAQRHFQALDPDYRGIEAPVHEFPELFQDVGKAYASLKTEDGYREALKYLQPLTEEKPEEFELIEVWSIMAACYMSLHRMDKTIKAHLDDAARCYLEYVAVGPETSSARVKLIDIYLGQGREYEAQKLVYGVKDSQRYLLRNMQAQHLLDPKYVACDAPQIRGFPSVGSSAAAAVQNEDGEEAPGTAKAPRYRVIASSVIAPEEGSDAPKQHLTKTELLAMAPRAPPGGWKRARRTKHRKQLALHAHAIEQANEPPRQNEDLGQHDIEPPQTEYDEVEPEDETADPDDEATGPDDETVQSATTPDIDHEVPLPSKFKLGVDGKPRRYGRPRMKVTQRRRRTLLPHDVDAVALDKAHGNWERMCALEADIEAEARDAELQWITLATHLVEDFIIQDRHFPNRDKHEQFRGYGGTGKWYQYDLKTETFRNIHFETWCDVFCRLGLFQAKHAVKLHVGQSIPGAEGGKDEQESGEQGVQDDEGEEFEPGQMPLRHQRAVKGSSMMASMRTMAYAANAHPFHHNQAQVFRIHATWLACALTIQEEEFIQMECRYFTKAFPQQSDTFRLYSIAARLFPTKDRTWYNAGPNQKYFLRQIKLLDYAKAPPETRRIFKLSDQERKSFIKTASTLGEIKDDLDPTLLALYGHIIMAGGITNSAMYYYFRALALVPEDPIVLLCIANCYIVQGFKRLTTNRTYNMQVGSLFMHKYYDIRTKQGPKVFKQEAEFNLGHMWHLLGLVDLAVPRYEKAIALSGEVHEERRAKGSTASDCEPVEDFAADAAFALSTIMATNGAAAQARRLREEWLTI